MRNLVLCFTLFLCLVGCASRPEPSSCEEAIFVVEQLPYARKVIECISAQTITWEDDVYRKLRLFPNPHGSDTMHPVIYEHRPKGNAAQILHYVLFQTTTPYVIGVALLDASRPPAFVMLDACNLSGDSGETICGPLYKEQFEPPPNIIPPMLSPPAQH